MGTSQTGRVNSNAGAVVRLAMFTVDGAVSKSAGVSVKMEQIAGAETGQQPKSFEFPYRPLPVSKEGFGPEMAEVERPYDVPLLNVKSGKLRRVSFEAPLSIQSDGVNQAAKIAIKQTDGTITTVNRDLTIDQMMKTLREIVDEAIPVKFTNMPESITGSWWYVSDLTLQTDRTSTVGRTLRETAQFTLVEYAPYNPKFVFLRPFLYAIPNDKAAQKALNKKSGGLSETCRNICQTNAANKKAGRAVFITPPDGCDCSQWP